MFKWRNYTIPRAPADTDGEVGGVRLKLNTNRKTCWTDNWKTNCI